MILVLAGLAVLAWHFAGRVGLGVALILEGVAILIGLIHVGVSFAV